MLTFYPGYPSCGSGSDVTSYIAASCNGQALCTFTVNYQLMGGDPYVNCAKPYSYSWRCCPGGTLFSNMLAGEATGKSLTITCLSCSASTSSSHPPAPPPGPVCSAPAQPGGNYGSSCYNCLATWPNVRCGGCYQWDRRAFASDFNYANCLGCSVQNCNGVLQCVC